MERSHLFIFSFFLLVLLQLPVATLADSEFLRLEERERERRRSLEETPDVRLETQTLPESGLPSNETPCFALHRVSITGKNADYFSWAARPAQQLLNDHPELCIGASGINELLRRTQNSVISRGYTTTRMVIAPQDLNKGVLEITVIPGRVEQVRVTDTTSPRVTLANALPLGSGDLLNLRAMEQGLENLQRVPTANANITITPGEQTGGSDLVVDWQQRFPLRVHLSLDDSGSRSTGKYQGNATLSWDNPLTLNDLFYVSKGKDLGGGEKGKRGTENQSVHYSIPWHYWLFSINASESEYYQEIFGAYESYIYSGESQNINAGVSRLIYRDSLSRLTFSLDGWIRRSRNFINDTEITLQKRNMAGWEAGTAYRRFVGQGSVDWNLKYKKGTGAFGALKAPEEDYRAGSSRPEIISSNLNYQTPLRFLNRPMHYSLSIRNQWNRTHLVGQDFFSIGGRYTVRGFDGERSLASERGWLTRNDLTLPLGQTRQSLYIGLDYGRVNGPSATELTSKHLAGAAFGLKGQQRFLNYDFFSGTPLSKPSGFEASDVVFGFNLSASF